MKKLLVLFVALLLAGSAYALVETSSNGPQNITSCYMIGTEQCTSGSVVVLQTTSSTYPGREVTGSVTQGQQIYGVVVDTRNLTVEEMALGQFVRVQTYGYCPIIRTTSDATDGGHAIVVGDGLVTSLDMFKACTLNASTTANAVSLDAKTINQDTGTVAGILGW